MLEVLQVFLCGVVQQAFLQHGKLVLGCQLLEVFGSSAGCLDSEPKDAEQQQGDDDCEDGCKCHSPLFSIFEMRFSGKKGRFVPFGCRFLMKMVTNYCKNRKMGVFLGALPNYKEKNGVYLGLNIRNLYIGGDWNL